jgi:hypothetical protein
LQSSRRQPARWLIEGSNLAMSITEIDRDPFAFAGHDA